VVREADAPDEAAARALFDRPQPVAVLVPVGAEAQELLVCINRAEVAGELRNGVQPGELGKIVVAPEPQA
jgi:hypothetical protein